MTVRYLDWSYWLELSGGSRTPIDAARRIRDGFEAFRVRNDGSLDLADELRQGIDRPRLIVVSAVAEGADVVLEGHARLTATALAWEALPAEVELLRGVSPRVAACCGY